MNNSITIKDNRTNKEYKFDISSFYAQTGMFT